MARTFSFERMIERFEAVTPPEGCDLWLPQTVPFARAMKEVALLFNQMGSGFLFVRREILAKVAVLDGCANMRPETYSSLQVGVEAELDANTVHSTKPPSVARSLFRLMWATRFLYILMLELDVAFQNPKGAVTLRMCVSTAYECALAEHHGWAVRKGVAAALYLLPSKEHFLEKLGVDLRRRDEYLERIQRSLKPLIDEMYRFYGEKDLLTLP